MKKFGIVGIGSIANTYIRLLTEGKIIGELTSICSRNAENMQKVVDKFSLNGLVCFTDYEEMLQSGKIDMVIICTPHPTHISFAKKAMENGIHPLIEKPIAIDVNEAKMFLEFTKKYPELTCGVAFSNRMGNGFMTVKKMLDEGAVGKIKRCSFIKTNHYRTRAYHKSAPWRGTFEVEGGGVLMTQASHQLDMMIYLAGSFPKWIQGFCNTGENRDIEVENEAHVHMVFEDGFTGQFTASSHEMPGTDRLEISGENGQIILENSYDLTYTKLSMPEPVYANSTDSWFDELEKTVTKINVESETTDDFQAKLINNFISSVANKTTPICTVAEAVNDLILISAIYKSSDIQQRVLFSSI